MSRIKAPSIKFSRDTALFLSGLAGIAYETLAQGGERPTLLLLFAAMVGLPAFLRSDERTHKATEEQKSISASPNDGAK